MKIAEAINKSAAITPFINHCITLRPRVICLLFGIMNLTLRRFEALQDAGYTLTKQHHTWWNVVVGAGGLVVILHFELEAENEDVAVTYDYHLHKSKAGGDGK